MSIHVPRFGGIAKLVPHTHLPGPSVAKQMQQIIFNTHLRLEQDQLKADDYHVQSDIKGNSNGFFMVGGAERPVYEGFVHAARYETQQDKPDIAACILHQIRATAPQVVVNLKPGKTALSDDEYLHLKDRLQEQQLAQWFSSGTMPPL